MRRFVLADQDLVFCATFFCFLITISKRRAKFFHAQNAHLLATRFVPVGHHLTFSATIFLFFRLQFQKGAQKFFIHRMHNSSSRDLYQLATTSPSVPRIFCFSDCNFKKARKIFSCTECTTPRPAICTSRPPPPPSVPRFFLFFLIAISKRRAKFFHAQNTQLLATRFVPVGHPLPLRCHNFFSFSDRNFKKARKIFSCTECTSPRHAICTSRPRSDKW